MALARFGIVNGRKVALHELCTPLAPSLLDSFSAEALRRAGFLEIAEKIAADITLDQEDLRMLLSEAGIPVLMKLVSLKKKASNGCTVTPAVVLPLRLWLGFDSDLVKVAALAHQFLETIPHTSVSVSFDQVDLSRLDRNLIRFFKIISRCRRGISMVGPRIDQIVEFVGHAAANSHSSSGEKIRGELMGDEQMKRVREILLLLKSAGFERLMAFSSDQFLDMSAECGFSNSFITYVDHFGSVESLVEELVRVKERASVKRWVDVWSPGVKALRAPSLRNDSLNDFKLLRVLAVAALYFDNRPQVRASSRYLSSEAILFAKLLGADDLGFGAFGAFTKNRLNIRSFQEIEQVTQAH